MENDNSNKMAKLWAQHAEDAAHNNQAMTDAIDKFAKMWHNTTGLDPKSS